MGYYELVAIIQHDISQPQEQETVRILQMSGAVDKELHCIDKNHERVIIEIKDIYDFSNKPGVLMKRLITRTPTSFKEKITTQQTKTRNMFLIKEGLREIREDIIDKVYKSTPRQVVDTKTCGTDLIYLTLESITIPKTTFTGALVGVSFFKNNAAILEVEKKEKNFSVIKKATNFDNFIKEIFTINASPAGTLTQVFSRSTDDQIDAISAIEDAVIWSSSSLKPEEREPWSEDAVRVATSSIPNRISGSVCQPYKPYKPYKPLEKEFFFKEFSGA